MGTDVGTRQQPDCESSCTPYRSVPGNTNMVIWDQFAPELLLEQLIHEVILLPAQSAQ